MVLLLNINMGCGIYKLVSTVNDKIYIGSTKDFAKRKWTHLKGFSIGRFVNSKLKNHYLKYGEDSLKFEVVELCDPSKLIEREQYYMDTLNPEFNIRTIADRNNQITLSEEHKKKLSIIMTGRKLSEESKLKISIANTGRKRSEKTKQKIRDSKLGTRLNDGYRRRLPVIQYDLSGNIVNIYSFVRECSQFGFDPGNVSACCRGIYSTHKGFKWSYFN